jgi:hypothetical protein
MDRAAIVAVVTGILLGLVAFPWLRFTLWFRHNGHIALFALAIILLAYGLAGFIVWAAAYLGNWHPTPSWLANGAIFAVVAFGLLRVQIRNVGSEEARESLTLLSQLSDRMAEWMEVRAAESLYREIAKLSDVELANRAREVRYLYMQRQRRDVQIQFERQLHKAMTNVTSTKAFERADGRAALIGIVVEWMLAVGAVLRQPLRRPLPQPGGRQEASWASRSKTAGMGHVSSPIDAQATGPEEEGESTPVRPPRVGESAGPENDSL